MQIYYASSKMKKILENERLIRKYYSNDYKRLINRLSELHYAHNLSYIPDVPPPRRHKLYGNRENCWGIDYSKNYRIVITPVGEYDSEDLRTITQIKILELEDYH